MRYLSFCLLLALSSCIEDGSSVLPSYTGAINEVVVVMDDYLWEDAAGDSLRAVLISEVPGISWNEPLFDLVHINSSAFSRIFKTHRNLIIVQKGSRSKVYFKTKTFSQNQWLCIVEYQSVQDLATLLGQYAPIIAHKIDQREGLRYLSNSPQKVNRPEIKQRFNVEFNLPKEYDLALDTNSFSWFEYSPNDREIIKGIFIYEFPLSKTFNTEHLLAVRDSVLQLFVPGSTEGSFMTTERLYTPYITTFQKDSLDGLSIKGLWKMQNAFMGGAFTSYFLKDTINNRGFAVEGFLFNPGQDKRNSLQELQWLISDFRIESSNSE